MIMFAKNMTPNIVNIKPISQNLFVHLLSSMNIYIFCMNVISATICFEDDMILGPSSRDVFCFTTSATLSWLQTKTKNQSIRSFEGEISSSQTLN
jgi:hypothetical protein